MAVTTSSASLVQTDRDRILRRMLDARRQQLVADLHTHMESARTDSVTGREVLDEGERSDVEIQGDIAAAVLQLKSETLTSIDEALRRLDAGTYGRCVDCDDDIAEARLRALPFALRCLDCEDTHEAQEQRRRLAERRGGVPLFREATPFG